MTIALTAALILTLAGFLILLDRRDSRERDERAQLLQRIQAPHAAVHEHHAGVVTPEPQANPMPMSDEEVAQMMNGQIPDGQSELERRIAWMEAVENGTGQLEDGLLT